MIATIFALGTPEPGPGCWCRSAVSVIPAALMVTTVRFRSFRGLLSPQTTQARAITTVLSSHSCVGLAARRRGDGSGRGLLLPAHGAARES